MAPQTTTDDGEEEPDWDVLAGEPPARNGSRKLVTMDESTTPYYGDRGGSTDYDFLGVTVSVGTSWTSDTIGNVRIKPRIPGRPGRAAIRDGYLRIALEESGGYDLYDDGDATEPLAGYQAETTGDYRQASPEDPRGDGVYARDGADSPLTAEIANIVTREGGRIPVDFSAHVQNEGYARARDWTVYAPGHNPYHVAAAVTDLLQDSDGVSDVRVSVSDQTAAEIARDLRSDGIGYVFDPETESDLIERALRELRWQWGLPTGRSRALDVDPCEAHYRLKNAEFEDHAIGPDYEALIKTLARHPGDAWDYHEISIHIDEEAEEAYHG